MNATHDEERVSRRLARTVIVAFAVVVGFGLGWSVHRDGTEPDPTTPIAGRVDGLSFDPANGAQLVCLDAGTVQDPRPECAPNLSGVDLRAGDRVDGVAIKVPIRGGTVRVFYLNKEE